MTKIYIDGEEYEPTETGKYMLRNAFEVLFKPVKKPEWEVSLDYAPETPIGRRAVFTIDTVGLSEDQAQLIKESFEDLLVFIMGELTFMDLNAANKARQAMKDDK